MNLMKRFVTLSVVMAAVLFVFFSAQPVSATSSMCGMSAFKLLQQMSCCAAKPETYYGKPYLTWQGNPSTTITINYHTAAKPATVTAQYGTESKPSVYAASASGESWQIPGLEDGRYVNSIQLTGLTPGTMYYFRIGDGTEFSDEYKFRTIPDNDETIRYAIGGDTLATPAFGELVAGAAAENVMFFVVGGDLAYDNGDVKQIDQWNNWFGRWFKNGTTADGRLMPMIMGIGNHEVNKDKPDGPFEERAPTFYGFFPQGGKTFLSHQFGANLGFIMLDSSHLVSHEEQVPWLEEQLKGFSALPFRVAAYHVPLYPSHREFDGGPSVAGRTYWLPLFDKYNLTVGFENHDHDFKRTKRLRNNELNEAGTLYVGDGNAGVMPRDPKQDLWYMEKVSRESHLWIVDVSPTEIHLRAMNRSGEIFDETTVAAPVSAK